MSAAMTREDTLPIDPDDPRGPSVGDIATRLAGGEAVILAGRYRLIEELGHGGMGTVYLGECAVSGRLLAIKILDTRAGDWLTAFTDFLSTARIAAKIRHRNVVRFYERGSTPEGVVYLTMEPLHGRNLGALIGDEELRWDRIRAFMRQICAGMEAIHARGVIHRDLKPSNCFVLADDTVKILDFGIARLESSAEHPAVGTPAYMAPEQIAGEHPDRRCDVYSAGVLLFELLCGRPPFVGDTARAILDQQLHSPPPKLWDHARVDAPRGIESIIARALAKRPGARFSSMEAMDAALSAL